MGLLSGSVSYLRYRVSDGVPGSIKDFVLARLKEFSFREIDQATLTEKTVGWVSAENMASTFYDDLHFAKDPYLVFSLRIDVRRIPGLARKAAQLREELKFKKSTGQERLRKQDKEMIKDEVWQALIKKALPAPAVYDVCWNISNDTVLFFSTSKAASDEFSSFFYRSFGIKLVPMGPAFLAGGPGAEQNGNSDPITPMLDYADE